ncbi:MAG: stalk domain-containing protein [Oscillospiraceae bacterium]|nr:stalk domain-containing protein [Oscillospiraceae bacterium]
MTKKLLSLMLAVALLTLPIYNVIAIENVVVATVDGINITADDVSFRFREAENVLWPEYHEMFPNHMDVDYDVEFRDGLTFAQAIRREAVRLAATDAFILREAVRLGTDSLTEDEIDAINVHIISTREHFDRMEPNGFNIALTEAGFRDENHWRVILENQRIMQNAFMAIIDNPDEMARLGLDDQDSATERANAILKRIRAGEDFDTLMHLYSEDPGLIAYPNGYTFAAGVMVPEFEQSTRNLAIGEISEPIRTAHGYHIIMRIEPFEEGMLRPLGENENLSDLYAAKHILISAAQNDEMMVIFNAFEAMVEQYDIVFLPALDDISVEPIEREVGSTNWRTRRINVYVNHSSVEFDDAEPIILYDTTFVPFRAIFEALGADVEWHDYTRTVAATLDGMTIELTIDNLIAIVNGEGVLLDSWAFIDNNRTFVPLRFIAENFGFYVEWDEYTNSIFIEN